MNNEELTPGGGPEHVHDWPNAAGFHVETEQRGPAELHIKGRFPAAVAGTLLRTGPSAQKSGDFQMSHWFDGFTQVYRFQLLPQADGTCRVWYNSRRQCDGFLEEVRLTKRLDKITFAQKRDPCEGFFGKLKVLFFSRGNVERDASDVNAGVTIHTPVYEGDSGNLLETRTDNFQLKTIDPETLEPVGITNQTALHPALTGPLSCAHAQFDPVTGDCYNFNIQFGRFATYRVFRHRADTGGVDILATISAADLPPAYIHAFFLSEHFVVLCVWNSHLAGGGLKVLWERNFLDAITPFDARQPAQWLVIDRTGDRGLVKRFSGPALFAFHTVNAYEEENATTGTTDTTDIICEVVEYASSDIMHGLYYDHLVSDAPAAAGQPVKESRLSRYRLDDIPLTGSWNPTPDHPPHRIERASHLAFNGDLPTLNPAYRTKPHRYVYGMCDTGRSSFYDSLIKVDTRLGEQKMWWRRQHTPGEPVFVIDPERRDREDGGWLLSCVLDGTAGTSYLLCLDAETLEEVGTADVGVPVGIGFHGAHIR